MCEKEGYIERFYVDEPNDKVDFTIKDMQRYTRTLIEEETNLSNMIEQAIKQNAKEDEDASKNTESDIVDDADMSIEDLEKTLEDKDFEEFSEFLDSEQDSIDDTLDALLNGEGEI
jgi:replicative DNA helicase